MQASTSLLWLVGCDPAAYNATQHRRLVINYTPFLHISYFNL